jgi:hypothetical protein
MGGCSLSFDDSALSYNPAMGAAGATGRQQGGAGGEGGADGSGAGAGQQGAPGSPDDSCSPACAPYDIVSVTGELGDFIADAERVYWVERDLTQGTSALSTSLADGRPGSTTLHSWGGEQPQEVLVDAVEGGTVYFASDVDGLVGLRYDDNSVTEYVSRTKFDAIYIPNFVSGPERFFYLQVNEFGKTEFVQVDKRDGTIATAPADNLVSLLDIEGDRAIVFDTNSDLYFADLPEPGGAIRLDELLRGLRALGLPLFECVHDAEAYYFVDGADVIELARDWPFEPPVRLAIGERSPSRLRVGGQYVYWLGAEGDSAVVRRARKDGASGVETVASGARAGALEFAGDRIIWQTVDGKSLRALRQP